MLVNYSCRISMEWQIRVGNFRKFPFPWKFPEIEHYDDMGTSAPQANILQFHDEYLSCRVERWRVGKPMAGRTQIFHLKYFWHPDDRWGESWSGSDVTAGPKLGHHTWFRWFVKLCRVVTNKAGNGESSNLTSKTFFIFGWGKSWWQWCHSRV